MNQFFHTLENLPLSVWVRESGSIWGFGTVLVLHTIGMSVVAGLIAMICLRLLGIAPMVPLKPMEKLYKFIWWGFGLNALTGTILIMQDAVSKLNNWDFYLKLVFIFMGLFLLKRIRSTVFAHPDVDKRPIDGAKMLALASLFCWLGAITCGRLLAYVGPVAGLAE